MDRWTKIDERCEHMPLDTPLLVVVDGTARIATYFVDDADDDPSMRWESPCGCLLDGEPTHWMALPRLPETLFTPEVTPVGARDAHQGERGRS